MSGRVYYNEFSPDAIQLLQIFMGEGIIPKGVIDTRSIKDVEAKDLKGFNHCHFFAGYGGHAIALAQAGWPSEREIWSGSCPCQSFSAAGNQEGFADSRDLWPTWFELIRECEPEVILGEQVERAIKFGWLDRLENDLETAGYQVAAAIIPAAAVNAPHKRDRLWFFADRQK